MPGKSSTRKEEPTELPELMTARSNWMTWRAMERRGRLQKPPCQASNPRSPADYTKPEHWSDYATARAAVEAGDAHGLTFVLTPDSGIAALDLDDSIDPMTGKPLPWAREILKHKQAKHAYIEYSPSGSGLHIWGLTSPDAGKLHTNDALDVNGTSGRVEIFRCTTKPLTVTGRRYGNIKTLGNIGELIDWAAPFVMRHKAVAAKPTQNRVGSGLNGRGHDHEHIEALVREVPDGADRSAEFHRVVGYFRGIGWDADQIEAHLEPHPDGVGGRYQSEGRLRQQIENSLAKFAAQDAAREPRIKPVAAPKNKQAKVSAKTRKAPVEPDDGLPQLHAQGKEDRGPPKSWLIKWLMPKKGVGLLAGQWGTKKTFVVIELGLSVAAGPKFADLYPIKQNVGVLLFAYESSDIKLRVEELVRHKYEGQRTPFRWYEDAPQILAKGALDTLIVMAQKAEDELRQEFGLPLGLILIDTLAAGAGYPEGGSENDAATTQAVMNQLRALAQTMDCFVLAVDHFGKNPEAGTRGNSSKEASVDLVLACLGKKGLSGSVEDTRLAVRKNRGGRQGQQHYFTTTEVEAAEPDTDGDPVTTLIVNWQPTRSGGDIRPPIDPWETCRRQDQQTAVLRFKRALLDTLTEHGIEQPIPPDGPTVHMIDQAAVQQLFFSRSPTDGNVKQKRQQRSVQFSRALGWAERNDLIGIGEVDGTTYLWLSHTQRDDAEC